MCEIGMGIIWLLLALATADVYHSKGYSIGWGLLVGFMLGPVGLLIAVAKPKRE